MEKLSRRDFIKGSLGAAALMAVPSSVLGKSHGHVAPSDKLNIAGIGIGGVGRRNLKNMSTENIVALCDVDWTYADKTFKDYPNAILYKDWRKMFDEIGNSIDAVLVATPDHNHAVITATAMTLGKHAYTQKPLTHSVYEARLLAKLAKKYKVATQMGNQGNSFDWCRRVAEWIWSGVIGDVYEVHCWTDRPIWPQGLMKPSEIVPCPDTLDWDLFIGPAEKRPYHPSYTPWNWRGWYDFGTGALGDMACHIMDPVCWALNLKYPSSVIASSTLSNLYSPPHAEVITYTFPARPQKGNVNMPEVKIYWYDGGLMPPRPEELADGTMMGDENGGLIFVGTKGKIMTGCYGITPPCSPCRKWNLSKNRPPHCQECRADTETSGTPTLTNRIGFAPARNLRRIVARHLPISNSPAHSPKWLTWAYSPCVSPACTASTKSCNGMAKTCVSQISRQTRKLKSLTTMISKLSTETPALTAALQISTPSKWQTNGLSTPTTTATAYRICRQTKNYQNHLYNEKVLINTGPATCHCSLLHSCTGHDKS